MHSGRQGSGRLTQAQLAEAAKLHRTYINQLENERKIPSLTIYMVICTALGIRPSDFMPN